MINLTVTNGQGEGFATVHPCEELPLASSLNYGPGITRPNELVAKLSSDGTICVFVLTDVLLGGLARPGWAILPSGRLTLP